MPKHDRSLTELLSFVCLSEQIFQHAGGTSAGPLSPSTFCSGLTSQTRHDAALIELPTGRRVILVVFTTDHATERDIIPAIARELLSALPPR